MILALECFGVLVMVAVHVLAMRRFEARIRDEAEAEAGRQHAIYKQQKAFQQRLSAGERAAAKMVDETRATASVLKEEAHYLHGRADEMLRNAEGGGS